MAEVTAGELLIRIKADAKKLEDALKTSGTSVNTFSQKVESVSKKLTTTGMKMSLAITAPLTLIGKKALDSAMDVVESENLFEVSMGNMAEAARKWSEEFADSVGLNEYNVRKQVGTFNVMLTSMGLTEDAALDMSEKMTQLAYDMASFYNLDVEDAFLKIQAGITGEIEPLKRLGIIVNDTAVKQTAYKNGIAEVGEELTENQKIMGRYQTIMEATSKAQGDMARTIESPANQMRIFKEQVNLAMIELGKGLIPIMQEVIKNVKPLVEWFTNLNDTQKEWIVKLGILAASAGPVMMAAGQIMQMVTAVKALNAAMAVSAGAGVGSLAALGGAAAAVSATVLLTGDSIQKTADIAAGSKDSFNELKDIITDYELNVMKSLDANDELQNSLIELMQAAMDGKISFEEAVETAEKMTGSFDDSSVSTRQLREELWLLRQASIDSKPSIDGTTGTIDNLTDSTHEAWKEVLELTNKLNNLPDLKQILIEMEYRTKGHVPGQYTSGVEMDIASKLYMKQAGGEVSKTGYISDLDVIGIKGEWLLNKQLVNAIKTSRTDSMGITASGGKSGGDVYLNVTIPGMVIREDADIKKLTQSFYDEVKIKSLGAGIKW